MPQISTHEFERLPLRVHDFLAGVPLHDVWAIDRSTACALRHHPGRVFADGKRVSAHTLAARARAPEDPSLRRLGWDREPAAAAWETFTTRLTTADRSRSLVPAGTREGLSRIVYRFENEQLLEPINRTAHAAALSVLVETANGYRFYFGV
jgi:hypothetical protein